MADMAFLDHMTKALKFQHEALAARRTDPSKLPVQDKEPLNEQVYAAVLQGLGNASKSIAPHLIEYFTRWRKVESTKAGDPRKRVLIDQVYFETVIEIVNAGGQNLSDKHFDPLITLAIDRILGGDRSYGDIVARSASELIGSIADHSLTGIIQKYVREVEERLPKDSNQSRHEIKLLCEGMQSIRLSTDTTTQLEGATEFLRRCDPLKHTAPQRKSSIHHTMCEMLIAILQRMVKDDRPRRQADILDPGAMKSWHATISKLRLDITHWTSRHSKHIFVAYPLITLLVSLEDTSTFQSLIDSNMDQVVRNLRDKEKKTMALGCVYQYFHAYLVKLAPFARTTEVHSFLGRHTKALLSLQRKGNFHQPDQHDMMINICVTIAEEAPDYGLGVLIPEFMGDTNSWDTVLVGLRALYRVILDAPRQSKSTALSEIKAVKGNNDSASRLSEMLRNDHSILASYGVSPIITLKISGLLSRIITAALNNSGVPRTKAALEEPPGFIALKDALSCVPYIIPEQWIGPIMTQDLAGYTMHQSDQVRLEAIDVLQRVMTCLPARRNEIVVAIASYATNRIGDEYTEGVRRTLSLLLGLLTLWITLLDEKQRGSIQEADKSESRFLDLHRLEGAGLALLCVNNTEIRKQALDVLRIVRTLHRSLIASARQYGEHQEDSIVTYVYTILENISGEKAQQCFWDFSQWADLWRIWRPVKDDRFPAEIVDIQTLISRTQTQEDLVRWTRTISEVIKIASKLSPKTAHAAYLELASRALRHMAIEPMGRVQYTIPNIEGDQWRVDLVCIYTMAALACPPNKGNMSTVQLIATLCNALRSGHEAHQQMLIISLGYINQECSEILLDELQSFMEDYQSERIRPPSHPHFLQTTLTPGTSRKQPRSSSLDVRIQVAQILRILVSNLQPGFLRAHPGLCKKLIDFTQDTCRFLSGQPEASWAEVSVITYCLCCVVRVLSSDFIGSKEPALSKNLRGELFRIISKYCGEGSKGQSQQEMLRSTGSARGKLRSEAESKLSEWESSDSTDNLEHMAHLALASLLWGPAFENDISKHQGSVFVWLENMLTFKHTSRNTLDLDRIKGEGTWGPSRDSVARTALKNLLSTNPEVINVSIDQCYSKHAGLAQAYFQVLVEVYAASDLDIKPQILLSLVLYKMVDPQLEVRDDALHMLRVLSMRVWKEGLMAPRAGTQTISNPTASQEQAAVVVGNLQDTYQQFQYHVSVKLAREHPEISEGLCIEMMTRQLAASLSDARFHSLQHHILTALSPWMENITFRVNWKGNWSEDLMKSMYFVTMQHGVSFPHEIERLWCTVAAIKRNAIPILEFLITRSAQEIISQDLEPSLHVFDVGKRISLYLARTSPQQTIDHLNYEITQLIEADDEPVTAHKPASLSEFEFYDSERSTNRQLSYSSNSSRNWPSRSRSMSHQASIGQSGLTDLSAIPSSLITEFMPDVSQLHPTASTGEGHRMSDLIRSVSSARQNVAEGSTTNIGEANFLKDLRLNGIQSNPGLAPSQNRGPLMRAEVAVCLLAEIAYEHDEDFRGHLPLLLHAMLLLMDSTDSLVFRHAQQVITHLLYSLSVRHLELHRAAGAMLAEYEKVTSLLTYLQAMRGKRLWMYEDVSMTHVSLSSAFAITALTTAIVESIFFEKDLKERWAEEALKWMLDSNSRHLACRSHQIFRALKPAPSSAAFSAMLGSLEKCLVLQSQLSLEVAVEIMLTLQVMVESLEPKKLLLYPQLFLACLALLPTTFKHIYALAIDLFQKVLEKMEINNATTQHIILAATPLVTGAAMPQLFGGGGAKSSQGDGSAFLGRAVEGWPLSIHLHGTDKFMCIQQLLVKGLFKQETELCTIEAMACIADQIARLPSRQKGDVITAASLVYELPGSQTYSAGLGALLGEVETQLALSIISQLPWLCQNFRYSVHASLAALFVVSHARACRAAGFKSIGDALIRFRRTSQEPLSDILYVLCSAYTKAFFPRHAKVAIQRLMEVILKGDQQFHGSVLQILLAIFKSPDLDLGSTTNFTSEEEGLLSPVARLIQSEHSENALRVINAISQYKGMREVEDFSRPVLQWPKAISKSHSSDAQIVVETLGRLNGNWTHSSYMHDKDTIMPFLPHTDFQISRPNQ